MKLVFQDLLGSSPLPYVRKVLKACGQMRPPICHRTVTEYLRLKLSDELPEDFPLVPKIQSPELHETLSTCCARLNRERREVWFYKHMSHQRIRLGVFHEDVHFITPWHEGINVFECSDSVVDGATYSRQEREAFSGGAEFIMPRDTFVDDILSLGVGLRAVESLGQRYDSSLEATAIHYGRVNPRICGVVMIEPNTGTSNGASHPEAPNDQLRFDWQTPARINRPRRMTYKARSGRLFELPPPVERYPLRVRYASCSGRFPKFIRPGIGVDENNPIFRAWKEQKRLTDEIPAATFGSSARWSYRAECLPLGKGGKLLALLWIADGQPLLKLFT